MTSPPLFTCHAPTARSAAIAAAIGLGALLWGVWPAAAQPVIGADTTIQPDGPPERRADTPPPPGGELAQRRGVEADPAAMNSFVAAPAAGASGLATLPPGPLPPQPVVVELFTAQGCSSCPPADALLADMADRDDVLALSFHVDYWDYLGWPDGFASAAFTSRQQSYARAFHERGLYTPQMIIGGTDALMRPRPADLDTLIGAHRAAPPALALTLERDAGRTTLTLTPRRALPGRAEVLFLRYLPQRQVHIDAGENDGRRLAYRNIVLRMDKLAEWDGRRVLRLSVTPGEAADAGAALPPDTRHAIIVQQAGPGPILAAIRLD